MGWLNRRGAVAGVCSGAMARSDMQVEERGDRIREWRGRARAGIFCLRTHSSVDHAKADVNSFSSVDQR
jgi:hypothetical protein